MESEGFVDLMNPKLQKLLKKTAPLMDADDPIPDRIDPYTNKPAQRDDARRGRGGNRSRQTPQRQSRNVYNEVQYNESADQELTYDDYNDNELDFTNEENRLLEESLARKQRGGILGEVARNPIDVPESNMLTGDVPDALLEEMGRGRRQQRKQQATQGGGGVVTIDYGAINTIVANAVNAEITKQIPSIIAALKPVIEQIANNYAVALKKSIVNENTKLMATGGMGSAMNGVDSFVIGGDFKLVDKNGQVYKAKFVPTK